MSNQIITNKLSSVLTLAPLHDEYGVVLVLQPKGTKGDSKEISAETAEHEIILRVRKASWVSLAPVGASQATPAPSKPVPTPPSKPVVTAPPAPPPSKPVVTAPPPPPIVEPVPPPVTAPVAEETVQTTTVTTVETTTVTTDTTPPVIVEPPAKVTRAPRK